MHSGGKLLLFALLFATGKSLQASCCKNYHCSFLEMGNPPVSWLMVWDCVSAVFHMCVRLWRSRCTHCGLPVKWPICFVRFCVCIRNHSQSNCILAQIMKKLEHHKKELEIITKLEQLAWPAGHTLQLLHYWSAKMGRVRVNIFGNFMATGARSKLYAYTICWQRHCLSQWTRNWA